MNKAQGQTVDFVGLCLSKPVLSYSQLYVALLRDKRAECIKVIIKHLVLNKTHNEYTKNIVYKEVLSFLN